MGGVSGLSWKPPPSAQFSDYICVGDSRYSGMYRYGNGLAHALRQTGSIAPTMSTTTEGRGEPRVQPHKTLSPTHPSVSIHHLQLDPMTPPLLLGPSANTPTPRSAQRLSYISLGLRLATRPGAKSGRLEARRFLQGRSIPSVQYSQIALGHALAELCPDARNGHAAWPSRASTHNAAIVRPT